MLQDSVPVRGEVYFPNLNFECSSLVIDFGCILNDTEATRYVNMTNNSPMVVNYQWSFQLDSFNQSVAMFHRELWDKLESDSALHLSNSSGVMIKQNDFSQHQDFLVRTIVYFLINCILQNNVNVLRENILFSCSIRIYMYVGFSFNISCGFSDHHWCCIMTFNFL
jgi:hypothetical protein